MSRIDELIAELCPEGVEFRELGDVGLFIRGNSLQKKDLIDFGIGAIHYGQLYTHYGVWATKTKSFVSPDLAKKLRKAKKGDLVIATTSENDEDVCKAVAWLGEEDIVVSGDAYIYRHTLEPKYVAYFFQSKMFHSQKIRHITGTKVKRVSGESMAKFRIPIPPLEVQREIVKVLDTFTQLEAELEAELEARRRQYQYYRDALLNFDHPGATRHPSKGGELVRWATLGEIGSFMRGTGIQKSDFTETGVSCIHYGQIHTHYGTWADKTISFVSPEFASRLRKAHTGDLVIATTSEDDEAVAKAVAWLGDEDAAVSTDAYIFRHSLNPKYVSYFFQTESFQSQKKPHITGTKVRRISGESLAKIRIPIPPLSEQERIVAILDKFDALVNDLTSGLPAEIKARRQQYEYYRDRLLTFKEFPSSGGVAPQTSENPTAPALTFKEFPSSGGVAPQTSENPTAPALTFKEFPSSGGVAPQTSENPTAPALTFKEFPSSGGVAPQTSENPTAPALTFKEFPSSGGVAPQTSENPTAPALTFKEFPSSGGVDAAGGRGGSSGRS